MFDRNCPYCLALQPQAQALGTDSCTDRQILVIMNIIQSHDLFAKVVDNVIRHSRVDSLVPIALTACNFMEEVNLQVLVRESEHNYKNYTTFEDKVHINGASSLAIKFDSRYGYRFLFIS